MEPARPKLPATSRLARDLQLRPQQQAGVLQTSSVRARLRIPRPLFYGLVALCGALLAVAVLFLVLYVVYRRPRHANHYFAAPGPAPDGTAAGVLPCESGDARATAAFNPLGATLPSTPCIFSGNTDAAGHHAVTAEEAHAFCAGRDDCGGFTIFRHTSVADCACPATTDASQTVLPHCQRAGVNASQPLYLFWDRATVRRTAPYSAAKDDGTLELLTVQLRS